MPHFDLGNHVLRIPFLFTYRPDSGELSEHLRKYWDRDSRTYDEAESHAPRSPAVNAAWRGALARLLPLAGAEAAAMIRTTFAITTLEGSPAHNVIATTARAGVNVRVMVGDTVADVVAAVRRAIRDDAVVVEVVEATEASPVSPMDEAFELIEACVEELFPEAVVAPYVMMAATDSRFFTDICERVYRFTPFEMSAEERGTLHARDERIHVATWLRGIRFYERLLRAS